MSQKKRFLLRLDPKLYEVLEKWSADELRSVNAQIEYLLHESVRKAGRWKDNKRSRTSSQHSTELNAQETPQEDGRG